MGRKKICLVTTVPESIHAQRLLRGATAQCAKYDYGNFWYSSGENIADEIMYEKKSEKKRK